jgi:response regulator RpfG family c-di-GMP phosphodiesterase
MSEPSHTLLCVDDDASILSSLRRMLRPLGCKVLTAESGAQGLESLAREDVDLVISDMRMPEMDGAQFLERVKERSPETIRILLTGHADVSSTIAAINSGEIYRYISKPWDDNDVLLIVRHALERRDLVRAKRRLEVLTRHQNDELKELNAKLESKVKERTEALSKVLASLKAAHEKLKAGFVTSIHVFSNLVELRQGAMAGHSRRVAEHARAIAQRLSVSPEEVQDIVLAGLLHDIGKIGLSDLILEKSEAQLNGEERALVTRHPAKGEALLMGLEPMRAATKLIRSHHERWDGLGYPDGLRELDIPLGARILAVANDYDAIRNGRRDSSRSGSAPALKALVEGRGTRYDPQVVECFLEVLGAEQLLQAPSEVPLTSGQLKAGMVLAYDLVGKDGMLLLSRDRVLDPDLIEQIRGFERSEGHSLSIFVLPQGTTGEAS